MKHKIIHLYHREKNRVANMAVFVFLFVFGAMGVEYLQEVYINAQPASIWFEYHAVEVVQDTAIAGEHPFFISFAEIKRPVTLSWNDVLRCTKDGKDYFYRSYDSSYTYLEAMNIPTLITDENGDVHSSSWQYGHVLPDTPGEFCRLITTARGELPGFKPKEQKIISEPFLIK